MVDHPIFRYVLGCKVENVNLKLIDFDIKVVNENDKDHIRYNKTYVRVCSAQIVQIDFIERLFYLKRMYNIYLLAIVLN